MKSLPDYLWPGQRQSEALEATGTYDRDVTPNNLAFCLALKGGKLRTLTELGGQAAGNGVNYGAEEKLSHGAENGNFGTESQKENVTGPVAQRQSSGLIIHWS